MNECKLLIQDNIMKNKNNSDTSENLKDKYTIIDQKTNTKIVSTVMNEKLREKLYNSIFYSKGFFFDIFNKIKKKSNAQAHEQSIIKSYKFVFDKYSNGNLLEPNDKNIIDLAYLHLTNNNFLVEPRGFVEYKSYFIDCNINNPINFEVLKDDEIYNVNVETCIIFISNDENISGNIEYYSIENFPRLKPNSDFSHMENSLSLDSELFDGNYDYNREHYNNSYNLEKKNIKLTKNLILLMSGNQLYWFEPMYGCGYRNYIVIRFISYRK
jgi:hypothetical protein